MHKVGFDNVKYLNMQSEHIRRRIKEGGGKLYLEFGGKLFDDLHAARVLPGFNADSKVRLLGELSDEAEIIIVISAKDIEKNKIRSDLGITYDIDVLRLIDAFRGLELYVGSVVITQYSGQVVADNFKKKLTSLGIKVYIHYKITGYPSNIPLIVSEEGYGRNEYIETSRPLVVVTAPGPGSGKMATCMSQLYHEHKRCIKATYAKFETFPIWNLPLKHPINIAYEAATADLNDVNVIDPFHLNEYNKTTVNYNRDVEVFPVLSAIFHKISDNCPYKSPTDMGVNMAGHCITDDEICSRAAQQEIIRRYLTALCNKRQGIEEDDTIYKLELLLSQAGISIEDRPVVKISKDLSDITKAPACAIELPCGKIITGKTTNLFGASSACIINALKALADIPKDMHVIAPIVIKPIQELKTKSLGNINPRLHIDEALISLSISAATNHAAKMAIDMLPKLIGCEAHSSVILSHIDRTMFKKLGVNITCSPDYETETLYHK